MTERRNTRIEASCPICGTVECKPEDFTLRICTYEKASYYEFACPKCSDTVRKHADERASEILIAHGVKPEFWRIPAEALEDKDGPSLTEDDVLDFLLLLETPDWFSRLASADQH